MKTGRTRTALDQRGVALPMAMLALLMLMALSMAFATLATTEPVISNNHLVVAQARAYAEAGIERALWALSNPTDGNGISASLSGTAPAPYNGSTFIQVGARGGFTILVSADLSASERTVTVTGWTPTNDASDTRRKSRRTVQAIFSTTAALTAPSAVSVQGNLQLKGDARLDARSGHCSPSAPPLGGTLATGTTSRDSGSVNVYGPGNNTPNEAADMPSGAGQSFAFKWSPDDIEALKDIAIQRGTYYRGSVRFDDNAPMPNGIVFVDTANGAEFTASTSEANAGFVEVTGDIVWSGWLIVAGSTRLTGHIVLSGLVYLLDDAVYDPSSGSITGAIVAENRKTTTGPSRMDNKSIVNYNCQFVRDGAGTVTTGWALKPGSYREM